MAIDAQTKRRVKVGRLPLKGEHYEFMEMQSYLESPRWEELKLKAIGRDGNVCQDCGADWPLEVHHLRYPTRFFRGRQKYINVLEDKVENLVALCRNCHRARHGLQPEDLQRNEDSYIYTVGRREETARPIDFRELKFPSVPTDDGDEQAS